MSHPTGEVWCLSSNPRDGTLVVTCGGGSGGSNVAGGAATTKLWRIPTELLEKDDDLPYDDEDEGGGGNGGSGQIMDSEAPVDLISEATLFVDSDDVLGGRITSALFRPVDPDDEGMFADGGIGGGGVDAAKDLITVNAATGILTRWDLEAGATEVGQILPPADEMGAKNAAWPNEGRRGIRTTPTWSRSPILVELPSTTSVRQVVAFRPSTIPS